MLQDASLKDSLPPPPPPPKLSPLGLLQRPAAVEKDLVSQDCGNNSYKGICDE